MKGRSHVYMKATLLIKNIENLYTCDEDFTILYHAFIACHHDKIIEINTGSYKEWLDPATRVIDAQGECVVPAFIDCQFKSFTHVRLGDQLRQDINALYAMRKNGILTLICDNPNTQRMKLDQDVFYKKNQSELPVLHRLSELKNEIPETFLMSCGFGLPNSYVYSMAPISYVLFQTHRVCSRKLLESMTSLPAKEFGLSDRGSIEIGKTADLLVLQVTTIEHYFQTLGRPLIHRMIKNGIQFYPEWMVC